MNAPRTHPVAVALVLISLISTLGFIALDAGMAQTPWDTTDSAGHAMGFNDPLSLEHYRIALAHFRVQTLVSPQYAYSLLLLAAQGVALVGIGRSGGWESLRFRWFLGLQGLVFPAGLLSLALAIPLGVILQMLRGTFDREGFIDMPFVAVTAQPIWVLVSAILCFWGWRRSRRCRRPIVPLAGEPMPEP